MDRFLEQLRLRDERQEELSGPSEQEQSEIARLKRDLERQIEVERCLTKDLVMLRTQVADLRRQNEESKVKSNSMEALRDELLALQLELSQADKQNEALKKENKEVVDRWIERVNAEAKLS